MFINFIVPLHQDDCMACSYPSGSLHHQARDSVACYPMAKKKTEHVIE